MSRVRSTCASSPHATIEARWTNSCGAVPTVGRNLRSAAIAAELCEREDRLLRAERGEDVAVGIDNDTEAPLDPRRDRRPQLGQPDRKRVTEALLDRVDERLADH